MVEPLEHLSDAVRSGVLQCYSNKVPPHLSEVWFNKGGFVQTLVRRICWPDRILAVTVPIYVTVSIRLLSKRLIKAWLTKLSQDI